MLDYAINNSTLSTHLACRQGDARCNAARFLRCLSGPGQASSYFAYGNETEVQVCRGKPAKTKWHANGENAQSLDKWTQVNDIFEQNKNCFIFGFLGYGLGLVTNNNVGSEFPAFWLGIADLVIKFSAGESQLLHGEDFELDQAIKKMKPCACKQIKLDCAATLDKSNDADYLAQVELTLDWVHKADARRMTIARHVPLPAVDLLSTFHCQPSHNSLSRSFYLDIGPAAFVGKCPEVLFDGTAEKFNSYKLSGTYVKEKDAELDKRALANFLNDPKIISEHQLSADGFGVGIARLGEVSRRGPSVLDLDLLRHMMTQFSVTTKPHTSITDCLRAVLPSGVSPCAEGLPVLLAIEKEKRGPYYGLVGIYSPTGHASFTQILRSVFRREDAYYSWVGAAVTQGSSAKGELEESKLKLSDILVNLQ